MKIWNRIRLWLAKEDILEYQKSILNTHYGEVETMYQDIRKWRHNYRNHIQLMKSHVNAGDMEAIKRYLEELEEELHAIAPVIRTGNKMTDAIVNSKISLAKSHDIRVDFDGIVKQVSENGCQINVFD